MTSPGQFGRVGGPFCRFLSLMPAAASLRGVCPRRGLDLDSSLFRSFRRMRPLVSRPIFIVETQGVNIANANLLNFHNKENAMKLSRGLVRQDLATG